MSKDARRDDDAIDDGPVRLPRYFRRWGEPEDVDWSKVRREDHT